MNDKPIPLYVCIEIDENPTDQSAHASFTDLNDFLHDWNSMMNTSYTTAEEFNQGEEFRTIYVTEMPTS